MQWDDKSKKAFVQALNIKFLTTTDIYTNFQFKNDKIQMLFPSSYKKEDCQGYLEQVTGQYKAMFNPSVTRNAYFDVFPFCINLNKVNEDRSGNVKFQSPLDSKVIHNLFRIFINQLLCFQMDSADMPGSLPLTEYEKQGKGYIECWIFSQHDGCDLAKERILIKLLRSYDFKIEIENVIDENRIPNHCVYIHKSKVEQAVQRAIKDFPTQLFKKHPESLLMLFNIFYHDLKSEKEGINSKYAKLINVWNKYVHKATTNENTVCFDYCAASQDERAIGKIECLYGTKNFITKKGTGNTRVSFNFDLHNMNAIMEKVPCDIGCVKKAREFASEQMLSTASTIHTAGPSRTPATSPTRSACTTVSESTESASSTQSSSSNEEVPSSCFNKPRAGSQDSTDTKPCVIL